MAVAIVSTSKKNVIGLDGTVSPSGNDKEVGLVLEITRTSDGSKARTGTIGVVVPAKPKNKDKG
ncbi:hypothetical protein GZH47_09245 [Paenibacillus rhizovicinus]|uniref:Uncharacterized protein n=1 Tax=Paenibacillus rhizovicinus TaxID=2704463 RepID=A0A6C0NXR7_9BACL|nr:hypothetical protein [Paenibacillus rhizovicinus]QHW31020.1 hypothetical protein GZH47_09245 [Paenibacillus rhizovicinus]